MLVVFRFTIKLILLSERSTMSHTNMMTRPSLLSPSQSTILLLVITISSTAEWDQFIIFQGSLDQLYHTTIIYIHQKYHDPDATISSVQVKSVPVWWERSEMLWSRCSNCLCQIPPQHSLMSALSALWTRTLDCRNRITHWKKSWRKAIDFSMRLLFSSYSVTELLFLASNKTAAA